MIVVAGESLIDLIVGADGRVEAIPAAGPTTRLGRSVASAGRWRSSAVCRPTASARSSGPGWWPTASISTSRRARTPRRSSPSPSSTRRAPRRTTSTTRGPRPRACPCRRPGRLAGRDFRAPRRDARARLRADGDDDRERSSRARRRTCSSWSTRTVARGDPRSRGYRARLDRILGRADVVKVSVDDLAWLDPGTDPERRGPGASWRAARPP